MAETPKTRFQLCNQVADKTDLLGNQVLDVVQAIESLGFRIVPAELPHGYFDATKEAMASAYRDVGDIWENVYAAAIAASPFAPEDPNG